MGDIGNFIHRAETDFGSIPGNAPRNLESLAIQLFSQTDPLRQSLIGQAEDFLSGDFDVTTLPQFDTLKSAVESQFGRAQENIISTTPTGGALIDALSGLEGDRASTLTQGIGDIATDQLNRAFSLATGAPLQASANAFSGAAQLQGQMAQAEATRDAGTKSALGFGIGSILGGK